MRASDIMTTPVFTAEPWTPLKRVAELLVEHDVSAVPIVDESGGILGIISESDLVHLQSVPDPRRHVQRTTIVVTRTPHLAAELMTRDVLTVTEDSDVTQVARIMLARDVKQIPVVAGGKVTGIISRRDIVKVLARADAAIREDVQERLNDEGGLIGWFRTEVTDGIVTLTGPEGTRARRLAELLAEGVPGVVGVRFAHLS